jgi:hypothetical protein
MFAANENGFFLTFANGYQISVKWDSPRRGGFYCTMNEDGQCVEAEVAVFRPDGGFVRLSESDDVLPGQKPDEVVALMAKYSSI